MGFNAMQEENIAAYGGGGGYGGYGSSWCIIIVFFVIAWLLFRDGHRDGYRDGGYPASGFNNGCGPCVQPTFKDESNWEQEYHLAKELCCVDKDVIEQGCKDREVAHCEGEKTRALIEQNYIQDLRDKLTEKNTEVMTLKSEMFTEKKFDQMLAAIGGVKVDVDKQFCRTDAEIAKLACEMPKRPPVWAECQTPNTHDVNCFEGFPRRGKCDGFGFDGCCA